MAIENNFVWRGVTVPNAYTRFDIVTGGKRFGAVVPGLPTESIWQGQAGVYSNPEQEVPFVTVTVNVPWNGEESPYPSLYAALKAMPEFAGAIDV